MYVTKDKTERNVQICSVCLTVSTDFKFLNIFLILFFFDSRIVDNYYFFVTIFVHDLMATVLSFWFVSNLVFQNVLCDLHKIISIISAFNSTVLVLHFLSLILYFLTSLFMSPLSSPMMTLLRVLPQTELFCMLILGLILDYSDVDKARRFIQAFSRLSIIILSAFFPPVIDYMIINFITRFTYEFLERSICPWNPNIIAFVYKLLEFTLRPFFYNWPNKNPGAAQCLTVFRQCIEAMDHHTSIFCFWLFTHINMNVIMTHPLFKELEKVHYAKRSTLSRLCLSIAKFFLAIVGLTAKMRRE